ncbi:putative butyrate kinase [Synergistales bacterium]|nr:putative butyrate kinase [Synergistales bacterium]
MEKLLILNPGSTSTKIAVYDGEESLFTENVFHSSEEIGKYDKITDQYEFRKELVLKVLTTHGIKTGDLSAIVSRGGLLPPVEAGAYEINEDMVWQLRYAPQNEHASNLGAVIAYSIAKESSRALPAFIYDAVTVDEMAPIAKITGLSSMRRKGIGHNLNIRAACMRYADENAKPYSECSLIGVHMGGGITTALHHLGKIIDIISDEEGTFSPERAGGLPNFQLIKMAASGKYDYASMMKIVKSKGGLMSYFGTNDTRQVEEMAQNGDEKAKLVYEAMAYNISKNIGSLATVVNGQIDAIILTGGIAHSQRFTGLIENRVAFIAPVVVYAGENEMRSLALGGLRVLRGQEKAKTFKAVRGDTV